MDVEVDVNTAEENQIAKWRVHGRSKRSNNKVIVLCVHKLLFQIGAMTDSKYSSAINLC